MPAEGREEEPAVPDADGVQSRNAQVWSAGEVCTEADYLADERPVALVFNCVSHAVMMVSPCDLEDFALGFSLSEGIVDHSRQVYDIEQRDCHPGLELRITLASDRLAALKDRRRQLAGRSGCGVCGIESMSYFAEPLPILSAHMRVSHAAVQRAVEALSAQQRLGALTGAMHCAAWCDEQGRIQLLREDVGRHNALDKLIGALAARKEQRAPGFALISSRASYEMVQKAVRANMELLVAVSAATALAVDTAERCGLTLVGFARSGRQVVYTCPERLDQPRST